MSPGVAAIGVVGTGELGTCFVERFCSQGHEVWAFDLDDQALGRARAAGARAASGPAQLAAQCSVVVTCVTGPDNVLDCALGPGGLSAVAGPEHLVIETTTSLPGTTRSLAKQLG